MKLDFCIVGAQKAGTTALHALLGQHPQICVAEPKELHLFDQADPLDDARLHVKLAHAFRGRTAQTRVVGEATPAYCFFPHAIERLHRHSPDARIIMLLRHPAFRAFSHWRMERARGAEHLSFAEAIAPAGRARMGAGAAAFRTCSYVERGFFAPQVQRILAHFGTQRCLFLRTDAFWSDPQDAVDRVCELLGVLPLRVGGSSRMLRPVQVDNSLALDADTYRGLTALYRADIERVEALTQLGLNDWLTPDYAEPMSG